MAAILDAAPDLVGTPREAAWRDPAWAMFDMGGYGSGPRFLLETAVKKHDRALVEWLLAHGAGPNQPPARDPRRRSPRTMRS